MKLNQSGFSLLEIMVAAALLGGLALTGAKLMENQTKSMKTVEVKAEYNAVLADIRSILAIEDSCLATFPGANATNAVIGDIKQKPAFVATPVSRYVANSNWQLATAYGNGNVRILSYQLGEANLGAVNPTTNTKVGTTNLIINMRSGLNRTVGAEIMVKRIPINVETTAADIIIKCSSSGSTGLDNRYLIKSEGGDVWGPINMRNEAPLVGSASWINMYTGTGIAMANGTAIVMQEASYIDFTSDRRLKTDIKPLQSVAASLRMLRPVSYKWKSSGTHAYGVIAQELQTVFPELVRRNGPDNTFTVDYIQLTPILIKGVQELDEENQKLKKSISDLEKEVQLMKKLMCRYENEPALCNSKR